MNLVAGRCKRIEQPILLVFVVFLVLLGFALKHLILLNRGVERPYFGRRGMDSNWSRHHMTRRQRPCRHFEVPNMVCPRRWSPGLDCGIRRGRQEKDCRRCRGNEIHGYLCYERGARIDVSTVDLLLLLTVELVAVVWLALTKICQARRIRMVASSCDLQRLTSALLDGCCPFEVS